jgi:hypothetical protein
MWKPSQTLKSVERLAISGNEPNGVQMTSAFSPHQAKGDDM